LLGFRVQKEKVNFAKIEGNNMDNLVVSRLLKGGFVVGLLKAEQSNGAH
jgi:hypothetical protein